MLQPFALCFNQQKIETEMLCLQCSQIMAEDAVFAVLATFERPFYLGAMAKAEMLFRRAQKENKTKQKLAIIIAVQGVNQREKSKIKK